MAIIKYSKDGCRACSRFFIEVKPMDYINELMSLGYARCCATRIANTMIQAGQEIRLKAMIDEKKSIKEHVKEVVG